METSNTSIELFSETAKLPSEVIAIIVGYLPKCILPNLLYFPPIREIVASTILSDVQIGTYIFRHEVVMNQTLVTRNVIATDSISNSVI